MADLFLADVNHYHTIRDWPAYARFSQAVIVKATESRTLVDPMLTRHRDGAHAAGVRVVGMYHFWRDAAAVADQVENFCRTVGALREGEFAILDVEQEPWTPAHERWCAEVDRRLGGRAWVYGGRQLAGATSRPLWVARYPRGAYPTATARWRPGDPPFTGKPNIGESLWQFTDYGFGIPGQPDHCDMNLFHGSIDDLLRLASGESGTDEEDDQVDDTTIDKIARRAAQYVGGAPGFGIPQTATLPGVYNDLRAFVSAKIDGAVSKATAVIVDEVRKSTESGGDVDLSGIEDRVRAELAAALAVDPDPGGGS